MPNLEIGWTQRRSNYIHIRTQNERRGYCAKYIGTAFSSILRAHLYTTHSPMGGPFAESTMIYLSNKIFHGKRQQRQILGLRIFFESPSHIGVSMIWLFQTCCRVCKNNFPSVAGFKIEFKGGICSKNHVVGIENMLKRVGVLDILF